MERGLTVNEIEKRLFSEQDIAYRDFQAKLIPGIDISKIIGVRTPVLRKLAKEYSNRRDTGAFLSELPHRYYDENNLHSLIISACNDYGQAVEYVDAFLPYVDNWATCDILSPKVFAKNKASLANDIDRWLSSEHTYTVRFGVEMIMTHFLDCDFDTKYLEKVAAVKSDEYYIKMAAAWFFATSLAKNWDATVPYIENKRLDKWEHNKTIQKSIESYRITSEQKAYLRTLKIK